MAIQLFWRAGRMVRSQWRDEQRFSEVSEAARAAVRLQALVRGMRVRRDIQGVTKKAISETTWVWTGRGQVRGEAVRRAADGANKNFGAIDSSAWRIPPRGRHDESRRRSSNAVDVQSAAGTLSAVGPQRCTRYCGQSQRDSQGLSGSTKAREIPASKMAVAILAQR